MVVKNSFKKAVIADEIEQRIKSVKKEEQKKAKKDDLDISDYDKESDDDVKSLMPLNLLEKDFLTARRNIKKINRKGLSAFDKIVEKIEKGEIPKSIESLCDLMKTLVLANKEMMNIHEIRVRLGANKILEKEDLDGDALIDEEGNLLTSSTNLNKMVNNLINKALDKDKPEEEDKKKKKVKN